MIYFCIKFFLMPLTKEEFDVMKAHQFCDNRDCPKYGLVGQGNIKTHSFASGQVLCSGMGQNAICRQEVSLRRRPSCSIPDDPYLCVLGIRVLVPPGLPGFYPLRVSSFVASVLSVG